MAYTPQSWADGPEGHTPISASRLSHIEAGLVAAAAVGDASETPTGAQAKATAAQNAAVAIAASDATTKVGNHVAATDPHGDRAFASAQIVIALATAAADATTKASSAQTAAASDATTKANAAQAAAQASSLQKSANLSDVASASTARTNLGLGTAATASASSFEVAGAAATAQSAAITAAASDAANKYRVKSPSVSLAAGATLANEYDAALGVYNWKAGNTRKYVSSVAAARAGTALKQFLFVGDSITAGHYASILNSWPVLSANALQIPQTYTAAPAGGDVETRWQFTGMTTGTFFKTWSASGQVAWFSSDKPGTIVDIYYFNNSGSFTYQIDRMPAVTVTPTGANTIGKITVPGLINKTHEVVITSTSASGFLIGANVYGSTGLLVHNWGSTGSKTADWTSATFSGVQSMSTTTSAPDVVFISLGVNDAIGAVSAATYQTNLASLVATYKALASAPDVVLVGQIGPSSVSTATWQTFMAAAYAVADSANVPLIDVQDRLGLVAAATANGLMNADGIHPNALGQRAIASVVAQALPNEATDRDLFRPKALTRRDLPFLLGNERAIPGTIDSPFLSPPAKPSLVASGTGGTLAAGVYSYRITALNAIGETTAGSNNSVTTTGTTSSVAVTWGSIPTATGYRIYRTVAGGGTLTEALIGTVSGGGTLAFTDTGAVAPSGAMPTANTTSANGIIGVGAQIATGSISATEKQVNCYDTGAFTYLGATMGLQGPNFPANGFYVPVWPGGVVKTSAPPFAVEFDTDATVVRVLNAGNASTFTVRVDGQYLTQMPYEVCSTATPNDGGFYQTPITFTTRAWRRIRLEFYNARFAGVWVPKTATVTASPAPRLRGIVMGDSFSEPTISDVMWASFHAGYPRVLGELLGADIQCSGSGSTGYLNPGSAGRVKFRDRVSDVIGQNPDFVVVAGGINDSSSGVTYAQLLAEITLLIQALQAGLPNVPIFIVAPYWPQGGVIDGAFIVHDAAKDAAAACGVYFIDILTRPLRGDDPVTLTTTLAASASAGATSISLTARPNPASGVGYLARIGSDPSKYDYRLMNSSSGGGPFTTGVVALQYAHAAGEQVVVVGKNYITGTGRVGAPTGDGNADIMRGADGTHPSAEGHVYIAQVLAAEISALVKP